MHSPAVVRRKCGAYCSAFINWRVINIQCHCKQRRALPSLRPPFPSPRATGNAPLLCEDLRSLLSNLIIKSHSDFVFYLNTLLNLHLLYSGSTRYLRTVPNFISFPNFTTLPAAYIVKQTADNWALLTCKGTCLFRLKFRVF